MSTNKSFSTRLSLNIVLITSILFIIAIGATAISSHRLIAEEAANSAQNLLDATVKDIEKTLQGVEYSVINSTWSILESNEDKEYLYHITHEIVKNNPDIIGSSISFKQYHFPGEYFFAPYSYVDEKTGNILSKQLGNPDYDYFFMDWYQIPFVLGEPCWSEPYFDDGGSESLITTYSLPLKDEEGNIFAIVTADLSLDRITNALANIKPYPNSNVTMISRNGSYITLGENSALKGETIFSTAKRADIKQAYSIAKSMVSGEKGIIKYTTNGNVSFAVFGPLSNGWAASITCDYRDILANTYKMNLILIFIGLIGLLILFLICYYAIRKITQPLSEFTQSALSIASGNFNTVLPEIKSEDEIRQLRDSFEYMQSSITSYIENLKKSTAENERFESELNIASNIQLAMLSRDFPVRDDIDLHAVLIPAKEVGGDLYDFFIQDKYLYFTVGDVSGKGVPASLIMAITRAAFRFIAKMGFSMSETVSKLNNTVCDGNTSGMFVTLFAGRLDLEDGTFEYCNAGHNPIVVNGQFLDVKPNIAIGLFEDFPYQLQTTKLEKGSRIILYTDGVTEAERADKSQFGEERLLEWVNNPSIYQGAKSACYGLFENVKAFTDGNEPNDDITIMTIKIK